MDYLQLATDLATDHQFLIFEYLPITQVSCLSEYIFIEEGKEYYNLQQSLLTLRKESIYGDLWRMAWPVMISMVLHVTLGLVDMFWVGRLGTTSLASLALAANLYWMFIGVGEIIVIGTVALVARYQGAGETKEVLQVVRHSFWLALLVALFLVGFIFLFGHSLIGLYRVDDALHRQATAYLQITGVGIIFIYTGMALSSALQGVGDTRTPMLILFFVNLINMCLTPVFVFGLLGFSAMGVFGAGLATFISQAISFFLFFYVIYTGKVSKSGLKIRGFFRFSPQKAFFKKILQIGVPAALQAATRPVTGLIMMWIVALFGAEAMAAFGIGQNMLGFTFIFLVGLSVATSTVIGQSLGAGKEDLAKEVARKALWLGLLIQVVIATLYYIFAPLIMRLFGADAAVTAIGVSYLRVVSIGLLVGGPLFVLGGIFKGSGDTVPPMFSAIVGNWLIKLPCALLLALVLDLGTNGVWWAINASIVAELGMLVYYYRRGAWSKKEIRIKAVSSVE